jgi:Phosphoribosylpyrophosphate synthetase
MITGMMAPDHLTPIGSARMKLMTGNSNLPLAKAVADYLEIKVTDASVRRFADEEVFVESTKMSAARTCSCSSRPAIRPMTI